MPWPPTQVDTFKPHSSDWNAIVNALSTEQGSYNANQQAFSNYLSISISPAVNSDALDVLPPVRVSAGTQSGGIVRWRANSYDTSNHTRDFYWQPVTTSNAGAGSLSLFTQLDGGAASLVIRATDAGFVGIGTSAPACALDVTGQIHGSTTGGIACFPFGGVTFQVRTGTDQNFAVRNNTILEILAINDAGNSAVPIAINGTIVHFNGPGVLAPHAATAPGTPPAGQFYFYMDSADNKLKCKGPSGTVTVLGNP